MHGPTPTLNMMPCQQKPSAKLRCKISPPTQHSLLLAPTQTLSDIFSHTSVHSYHHDTALPFYNYVHALPCYSLTFLLCGGQLSNGSDHLSSIGAVVQSMLSSHCPHASSLSGPFVSKELKVRSIRHALLLINKQHPNSTLVTPSSYSTRIYI